MIAKSLQDHYNHCAPYVLQRLSDGSWVELNRYLLPLGYHQAPIWNLDSFTFREKILLIPPWARNILADPFYKNPRKAFWMRESDRLKDFERGETAYTNGRIYLYNDYSAPINDLLKMRAYDEKVIIIHGLKDELERNWAV